MINRPLDGLRLQLDSIINKCIHKRVILYGYGRTGKFLKWYAEYFHNIKIDYVITIDGCGQDCHLENRIFPPDLLDFDYKDVKDGVLWLAEPLSDDLSLSLSNRGYRIGDNCFDFYGEVYADDVSWGKTSENAFDKRKEGKRNIQFLEWLEWKYNCNFVTAVGKEVFTLAREHGHRYSTSDELELFTLLDRCHVRPNLEDGIFDFGCGKGSALVLFLDYGFRKVGGVEYEPELYRVLKQNVKALYGECEEYVTILNKDASYVDEDLDHYNWFYFYDPFDRTICEKCYENICKSIRRKKRKVHVISRSQVYTWDVFEKNDGTFQLVNEFEINTYYRIVKVYEH